jgi:hypothetical protein
MKGAKSWHPWWQPHLYAAAGTVVVMALGLALAVLTSH